MTSTNLKRTKTQRVVCPDLFSRSNLWCVCVFVRSVARVCVCATVYHSRRNTATSKAIAPRKKPKGNTGCHEGTKIFIVGAAGNKKVRRAGAHPSVSSNPDIALERFLSMTDISPQGTRLDLAAEAAKLDAVFGEAHHRRHAPMPAAAARVGFETRAYEQTPGTPHSPMLRAGSVRDDMDNNTRRASQRRSRRRDGTALSGGRPKGAYLKKFGPWIGLFAALLVVGVFAIVALKKKLANGGAGGRGGLMKLMAKQRKGRKGGAAAAVATDGEVSDTVASSAAPKPKTQRRPPQATAQRVPGNSGGGDRPHALPPAHQARPGIAEIDGFAAAAAPGDGQYQASAYDFGYERKVVEVFPPERAQ